MSDCRPRLCADGSPRVSPLPAPTATSSAPFAPALASNPLTNRGHGWRERFEAFGFPLASSLGYDNRGPADTNLLLVRPASDSFPHAGPKFPNSTWLATVPTSRMLPGGDGSKTTVTVTHLNLRVEYDSRPVVFSASQFRLAGSDGVNDLDIFSNTTQWRALCMCVDVREHVRVCVRVERGRVLAAPLWTSSNLAWPFRFIIGESVQTSRFNRPTTLRENQRWNFNYPR
jgi:hypothetical protein